MVKLDPWEESKQLYDSYISGDEQKTVELFAFISNVLKKYFFVKTGSKQESQDLTQITLLKIHVSKARFDPERSSLKTWVFTIATRVFIDMLRSSKYSKFDDGVEVEALESVESIEIDEHLAIRENLQEVIKNLAPIDRDIVYLYAVEGMSMSEIASINGLSENAVKLRASRSYKKLRELLKKQGYDS